MITKKDIEKLKSECDNYKKKYKEKSEELQKLSNDLNGEINEELTKKGKEAKKLYDELCASQKLYKDACISYVHGKLASMDDALRELFLLQHGSDMKKDNWEPVLSAL